MIQQILNKLKKDFKYASGAIILLIAYFALLTALFHCACPLRLITGYPCPGCGTTRAALALLNLNFKEAWEMNPLIYFLIVLGIIFFFERYVSSRNDYKYTYIWTGILVVFAATYYIWRMYMYFPDQAPMIYFRHNLLSMIKQML